MPDVQTRFVAPWLPSGEVMLAEMPLQGHMELAESIRNYSEYEALSRNYSFLELCKAVWAAHDAAQKSPLLAKRMWDEYVLLTFRGATAGLIFPQEQFVQAMQDNLEGIVYTNLNVSTPEAAREAIKVRDSELAEKFSKFDKDTIRKMAMRNLTVLYWRLRSSRVKEIITPVGNVALDWAIDKQAATVAILCEVVTTEEMKQLEEKRTRPVDLTEDLSPTTAADVEGKSSPTSPPSSPSSPGLPPSSAPSDGPGSPIAVMSQSPG